MGTWHVPARSQRAIRARAPRPCRHRRQPDYRKHRPPMNHIKSRKHSTPPARRAATGLAGAASLATSIALALPMMAVAAEAADDAASAQLPRSEERRVG